jgi:hypothetical protein
VSGHDGELSIEDAQAVREEAAASRPRLDETRFELLRKLGEGAPARCFWCATGRRVNDLRLSASCVWTL